MNGSRARSTHLSPERRWLFRHLWMYGGGGGKAPADGMTGVGGGQHEALHEIAHRQMYCE